MKNPTNSLLVKVLGFDVINLLNIRRKELDRLYGKPARLLLQNMNDLEQVLVSAKSLLTIEDVENEAIKESDEISKQISLIKEQMVELQTQFDQLKVQQQIEQELYKQIYNLHNKLEELKRQKDYVANLFTEETTTLKTPEQLARVFWKFVAGLCMKNPYMKRVYVHNLNFDIQYLLPSLHEFFDLKITVKDHVFKKVSCYLNEELLFSLHCSYAKTGLSLRNLAQNFKVETQKGHWPHK